MFDKLQLAPPSLDTGSRNVFNNSAAVQAITPAVAALSPGEQHALFANMATMPGPKEDVALERFSATWLGVGVGILVGVGGALAVGHFMSR